MFSIVQSIHDTLNNSGIPVEGVSYNNTEDILRIDFVGVVSSEQQEQAYSIARDVISREEEMRLKYEEEKEKTITPEKMQPLVDLLLSKGIFTIDEISQL